MKILHINDYEISGGAEVIFNNIYNELWGEKIILDTYIKKNKFLRLCNLFFLNFSLIFSLRRMIKKNNFDVILLHNYNLSPFSIFLWIYFHKNIVQIIHSCGQSGCVSSWGVYRKNYKKCNIIPDYKKCSSLCWYDKNKFSFFIYYFWLKGVVFFRKKYIHKFIVPSIALAKVLKQNNFKNVLVLNNYINLQRYNFSSKKENILLYVWGFLEYKWVRQVLKSFSQLKEKKWNFYLIWEWPILSDLQKKYYKNKNIKFLWFKNNKEVLEYYKKSKIVIIPSICFDNYPTVALEAIYNNCKVIGSNRWGIWEIIWKKNTFDILDNRNIQKKILEAFNNPDIQKNTFDTLMKKEIYIKKLLQYLK